MLVMISDQAYHHFRPAQEILEDLTRKKDTKEFQMAVVRDHIFLGISCFGSLSLQTIAGGCLFYDTKLEGEATQFPWHILATQFCI